MSYLRCLGLIEAIKFLYNIGKVDARFFSLLNTFEEKLDEVHQEKLKDTEKERLQRSINFYLHIRSLTTRENYRKENAPLAPTLPFSSLSLKTGGHSDRP